MRGDDPYWDHDADVLRNILGITNMDELSRVETAISLEKIDTLAYEPIEGRFDEAHLKEIHHFIFSAIYDWAGKDRTQAETPWTPEKPSEVLNMSSVEHPHVYSEKGEPNLRETLDSVFSNLKIDGNLQGLSADQFVKKIADHSTALWKSHPFRDGNTRTTVEFIRQLSKSAGHELASDFPQNKEEFRNALTLASVGETSRLIDEFTVAVLPLERAELRLSDKLSEKVLERCQSIDIDCGLSRQSSANPDYIEGVIEQMLLRIEVVDADVSEELPFERNRVNLEQQMLAERNLFEQLRYLACERSRIEVSIDVATHEAPDTSDKREGLKNQLRDVNSSINKSMQFDTGLSSDRKIEALQHAEDYKERLMFKDSDAITMHKPVSSRYSRGFVNRGATGSAERLLAARKQLLGAIIDKDLKKRVGQVDNPKSRKVLIKRYVTERHQRATAIRKAVENLYPDAHKLVEEARSKARDLDRIAEIDKLIQANGFLDRDDSKSVSLQIKNQKRIQYLTKSLSNKPNNLTQQQLDKIRSIENSNRESNQKSRTTDKARER